jgi:DinB superfamily
MRQPMTTEQILSVLGETPPRLRSLTGDLTEAMVHAAPEHGEWSVAEITAHLRSCADVWGRLLALVGDLWRTQ